MSKPKEHRPQVPKYIANVNGMWKQVKRLPFYKTGKKVTFTIVGHEFVKLLKEIKTLTNENINLRQQIKEQEKAIWKYHEILFPNSNKANVDGSKIVVRTPKD